MKRLPALCLLILYAAFIVPPAASDELVGIVEDSEDDTGDVEPFDMVKAGRVITLSPGGRLVLGYLRSC